MNCRPNCGTCCTAPSINSPIPGMRCVQLDGENRCKIFGQPECPAFCASLQAKVEMCNDSREQAMTWLTHLERLTKPSFLGLVD